jgi:hypothetical protein
VCEKGSMLETTVKIRLVALELDDDTMDRLRYRTDHCGVGDVAVLAVLASIETRVQKGVLGLDLVANALLAELTTNMHQPVKM